MTSAFSRQASTGILRGDAQLIQIMDAALADATRRAGSHLACRPGCTQCCYGAFAITPLDALRLRTAMAALAESNPVQAAAISHRAHRYLEEFGPEFPGDPETGILGVSPEEQAAFEDFASDAPCPALHPESGLCELYAARPMTCRVFGPPVRMASAASVEPEQAEAEQSGAEEPGAPGEEGLAVCELCFTEASAEEIAAAEMAVPYAEEQQLIEELQQAQSGSPGAAETIGEAIGDTIIAYCLKLPPPDSPQLS